jgi:hypothetical protein
MLHIWGTGATGGQMSKLPSISTFFPCYNDAGTIASMVITAKTDP